MRPGYGDVMKVCDPRRDQPPGRSRVVRYTSASGTQKPMLSSARSPGATGAGSAGHVPSGPRRSSSAPMRVLCRTRTSRALGILV